MSQHQTFLRVKALNDGDERIIEGWATTPSEDRHGDVVAPEGAKFSLPHPLLFAHDHAQPIGSVITANVTRAGIRIRARLAKGVAKAEEVWTLIREGALNSVSVGFRALKVSPLPDGGVRFDEWDWYETSVVAVPANPDAKVAIGKGIAYTTKRRAPIRVVPLRKPAPKVLTPQLAEAKAYELGGDEAARTAAGLVAALELLPQDVRKLAIPDHSGRGIHKNYYIRDFEHRDLAMVNSMTGEVVLRGQAPRRASQGLTPAQTEEVKDLLMNFARGVGGVIGEANRNTERQVSEAIADLTARLERLERPGENHGGDD